MLTCCSTYQSGSHIIPAVSKDAFYFVLASPSPGGSGDGSHFPKEVGGFGPVPAGIKGDRTFFIFSLALRAAGLSTCARQMRYAKALVILGRKAGVDGSTSSIFGER